MRNEKGLTLLELLLATAISSIFIFIVFSLFNTINLEFNSSSQRYGDDIQYRMVASALTTNMSDVIKVAVASPPSTSFKNKELRFQVYDNSGNPIWKTLYFNSINHTLLIYNFSGNSADQIASPPNSTYTNGIPIATNVSDVGFNQTAPSLVQLTITFDYKIVGLSGERKSMSPAKTLVTTIKVLNDQTSN
ncbi:prepilin-type N-terminal cleavage/methylation domain-containing protein [Aneurinibacillus sp. Ricciae_BoGa-3]|uniref:prepilin-type N-terminal cleavage/methylation domain-containing protein n=1 Tax=Aneurinibacillus sp. Ricciae_BoGa-3 TaxID=3022697 RepID=UPI0023413D4D|nr:prepilin-type N-terminal cleavage/methylation domain-containing protein [Aneurinibacillus sp. Ricciae_BoGa-3]WCK53658.1 prepilin-type N-terminal cleavage/methylation domain-containing protein [Aneurinibacillus sp. Ricciae_BoGa-3]